MKKLVFGLVATVVFSFNGFAASDVVNKEKVEIIDANIAKSEENLILPDNCFYTIVFTVYWPDGTVTQTSNDYSVWALDEADCRYKAHRHVRMLKSLAG